MTGADGQPLAGDGHDPEYARNDLDRLRDQCLRDQQSKPRRQDAQSR
jgi:hypothetical protein